MALGRVALVIAAVIALLLISPGSLNADEYRVLEGDTLSEIAERYGMTVEELAEANGIVDPNYILRPYLSAISDRVSPSRTRYSSAFRDPGEMRSSAMTAAITRATLPSAICASFLPCY